MPRWCYRLHNRASHCLFLAGGIFKLNARSESLVRRQRYGLVDETKQIPSACHLTCRVGPFASCAGFFTGRTLTNVPFTASKTAPKQGLGVPGFSLVCLSSRLFVFSCVLFVQCKCRVVPVQDATELVIAWTLPGRRKCFVNPLAYTAGCETG
jgi:hypothetical protein